MRTSRRSLLALLIALLLPLPAVAAIVLVQASGFASQNSASSTATLNSVVAGDWIGVCFQAFATGTSSTLTMTDSAVGATVQTAQAWNGAGLGIGGIYQGLYYVENAAAGTHTFTGTISASSTIVPGFVAEFSGLPTSASFDAAAAIATNSGSTAVTANPVTPAASGELALACVENNGYASITWGASLASLWSNTSGYEVLGSTSAFTASATLASSQVWVASVALFKPAAGSSCTDPAWNLATGSFTVPVAGAGSFWQKTGAGGSVNCTGDDYWQATRSWGVN